MMCWGVMTVGIGYSDVMMQSNLHWNDAHSALCTHFCYVLCAVCMLLCFVSVPVFVWMYGRVTMGGLIR